MADAKPRKARRVALGTAALALVWLFGVWPPPLWWRDHDHPAAREEPVPLVVAQPTTEGEGGGDRAAPRERPLQGSDSGALPERRRVGAGRLGRGRRKPRLLRRARLAGRREPGGRA